MDNMYMINVPYEDFVQGIEALERLQAVKDVIKKGREYASDGVYALLGIEKEEDA